MLLPESTLYLQGTDFFSDSASGKACKEQGGVSWAPCRVLKETTGKTARDGLTPSNPLLYY